MQLIPATVAAGKDAGDIDDLSIGLFDGFIGQRVALTYVMTIVAKSRPFFL